MFKRFVLGLLMVCLCYHENPNKESTFISPWEEEAKVSKEEKLTCHYR